MRRLWPAYLVAANTALLLVVLQVGAWSGLLVYDHVVRRLSLPPLNEAVRKNFAHLSAAEFTALERATGELRFRYEPGIGIIQAPLHSTLINVDDHGIRANGNQPRGIAALQGATWFFGGSTTFGEMVADHETIPAQLERLIDRPVINLGVLSYAAQQENALLAHYLRVGYRPALVLFLDGINESCTPEPYQEEMRELFRQAQRGYAWDAGGPFRHLLERASRRAARIAAGAPPPSGTEELSCSSNGVSLPLATLHAGHLEERAALCRHYRIDCRTMVQPFAGTHGPTADLPQPFLAGTAIGLRAMFQHLETNWRDAGAVFLTDVFDGYNRHPFIDEVHYSADANRVLAEAIASRQALR
jgi:hypothetical protein